VSRDKEYVQLDGHNWLLDLAFFVDTTNQQNDLFAIARKIQNNN
jgi:hypothetical protein